jgi:pyruvate,orthophosphate dikinase
VILVRPETSPEDIHGMHAARAILTSRGGMTSHAAVVARGMGRPCITGATQVRIDVAAGTFSIGGETVREGELVTIDGTRGEVLKGEIPTIEPELSGAFATLMGWADEIRSLGVRANAETPRDAETARKFGAEGIGLCRTEHMFFDAERIVSMREMILADDSDGRRAALAKLLPMQRQDFVELFAIMAGLPVTIRLLDPPLHEFLPHGEEEMREVAEAAGRSFEEVRARVAQLRENNPMLGHRGCRLGISHPEIYEMQARAIFEAALDAAQSGAAETAALEIMIPLVLGAPELAILRKLVEDVAAEVEAARGKLPPYIVGTMIELPRAALRAGDIAETADFFSFGTNDLTQTALGISRDDAASFMDGYVRHGLFERDPFASLDIEGVGELIDTACQRGRGANAGLKLGVCGEHGGDPASVGFFHRVGLDYVSCSPYRVPIARLAAAQAHIAAK